MNTEVEGSVAPTEILHVLGQLQLEQGIDNLKTVSLLMEATGVGTVSSNIVKVLEKALGNYRKDVAALVDETRKLERTHAIAQRVAEDYERDLESQRIAHANVQRCLDLRNEELFSMTKERDELKEKLAKLEKEHELTNACLRQANDALYERNTALAVLRNRWDLLETWLQKKNIRVPRAMLP